MRASRLLAASVLAALAVAPAARAAVDAFIWFENSDIKGESHDAKHPGWIEVSSFQLQQLRNEVSNSTSIGRATGGAGAGKVSFHEFQITKKVDKASPKLFEAATKGKHIPNVTIEMRKAGGDQQEYLVIKLQDVFISSYRAGGARGEGPEESMTLVFGAVKWEYTPQRTPTPGLRTAQVAGAAGGIVIIPNAITKVTPSAASANAGQALTFAVEGTGTCNRSAIDFGDGTVVEYPFVSGKSTPAPTHAYTKAGTFEIKVWGRGDPWAHLTAARRFRTRSSAPGHATASVVIHQPLAVAPGVAPAVRK